MEERQLAVWSHDPYANSSDVLFDASALPGAQQGDAVQITARSESSGKARHFNFIVGPAPDNAAIQISLSTQILNTLQIKPRSTVTVKLQPKSSIEASTIELRFKGYYLTRAEIYSISKLLTGKILRVGQRVSFLGGMIRLNVESMYRDGKRKYSGYISQDTHIIYRSESARLIMMLQLSIEMWDFDETGEIGFQKLVNSLIPELLRRLNSENSQHSITIILFTSLPDSNRRSRLLPGELEPKPVNHYRVAVDSAPLSQWSEILTTLRSEFIAFKTVFLADDKRLSRQPLAASKGNILEALRLTTTFSSNKFSDRDLSRTNLQVSIITASPGLYDCDEAELYQLSKMILGVEVGVELICLARPPLHITPMFRAKTSGGVMKHYIPTWMNVSFWVPAERYVKQWIPRCKIYDIQMMGVLENEKKAISVRHLSPGMYSSRFMKNYDSSIFKSQDREEPAPEENNTSFQKGLNPSSLQPTPTGSLFSKPVTLPSTALTMPEMMVVTVPVEGSGVGKTMELDRKQLRESLGSVLRRSLKQPKRILNSKASTTTFNSTMSSAADIVGSPIVGSAESPYLTSAEIQPNLNISPPIPRSLEWLEQLGNSRTTTITQNTTSEDTIGKEKPRAIPVAIPDSRNGSLSKATTQRQVLPRLRTSPRNLSPAQKLSHRTGSLSPSKALLSFKLSGPSPRAGTAIQEPLSIVSQGSMWRQLKNPSVIDAPSRTEAYGRWAYVYPDGMKQKKMNWKSFSAPASLPLTSDVFPTVAQFNEEYKFQLYDLAIIPGQSALSTPQLLDELIGARLQMGFQIAVGSGVTKVEANSIRGNPKLLKQIIPEENFIGVRLYMVREGLIHRLSIEQDDLINVGIYTWVDPDQKLANAKPHRAEQVWLRTKYEKRPHILEGAFFDPLSQFNINWNLLDQQLLGLIDYFNDPNAQYIRASRFVIIPAQSSRPEHTLSGDKLSIEEVRIEGILKIVTHIFRHKYLTGGLPKNNSESIAPHVGFYTGFLNTAPQSLFEEMQQIQLSESGRLNKSIPLTQLASELKGKWGPKLQVRRWHWKTFHSVILGDVLVNWILHNYGDIGTREDASKYAQSLIDQGFLAHVEKRLQFHDGYYFYHITSEYNSGADNSEKHEVSSTEKERITITRSVVVDIDPKKISPRPELCQIHVDRFHNPEHAFNIRCEWLNTTPRFIDDFFNGISRLCSNYALKLVQVPQADIADTQKHSPFRSSYQVKFCKEPLSIVPDPEQYNDDPLYFHHYFLKRMGFIFDGTAINYNNTKFQLDYSWKHKQNGRAQFIHCSGAVVVQVLEDMSFYMVPNTIFLSRYVTGGSAQSGLEDTIQGTFAKVCDSPNTLEDIFMEAFRERGHPSPVPSTAEFPSPSSSLYSNPIVDAVSRGRSRGESGSPTGRLDRLAERSRSRSRSREPRSLSQPRA